MFMRMITDATFAGDTRVASVWSQPDVAAVYALRLSVLNMVPDESLHFNWILYVNVSDVAGIFENPLNRYDVFGNIFEII